MSCGGGLYESETEGVAKGAPCCALPYLRLSFLRESEIKDNLALGKRKPCMKIGIRAYRLFFFSVSYVVYFCFDMAMDILYL